MCNNMYDSHPKKGGLRFLFVFSFIFKIGKPAKPNITGNIWVHLAKVSRK